MADQKKPVPEYMARKGEGRMDEDELNSVVKNAISQCVQFIDTELSIERAKATEYYLGKPFGNEEEGRSQVVLTEVRDAVDGMLPSLMRIFFGSEHTVEFVPTRPDNVEQAAQKTDYVRYVFEEENSGFLQCLSVIKDGLVRKLGVFAWGWDESSETKAYQQEGIDGEQLDALAADDAIQLTSVSARKDNLFDVSFTAQMPGKLWVKSVPPEEFIYNRQARSLEEGLVIGHRTLKTKGELIAMGISEKDISEYANADTDDVQLRGNAEEIARRDIAGIGRVQGFGFTNDPEMGQANTKILYCDVLMNVDFDGDGIAELRRICTIGPNYYPVSNEPADEKRFAVFCPYPEPHAMLGGSVADRTMDMQKINSSVLRAILDGGAAAAFPRTVYVEGQASVADIMNTAIGAPIRERTLNSVRQLETPFTAEKLLPVLQFGQEVIERRTGRNKGTAGLDADALQSTDKDAVKAVLDGGQEQIELMARVFAEGTLKPLFRGIGRLLQQKQPRAKVVRLRGSWVAVDPKSWDDAMDVTVNIALGSTFVEKKVSTLMAVAADQENLLMQLGLANPATSLPKFLNTRAKILSLQGIKDFTNYYNPLPPDWQPPPPPPTPQDPQVLAMQAEAEMSHVKAMKELAIKQDELTLKSRDQDQKDRQMQLDAMNAAEDRALKREELIANIEIEKAKIEAQLAMAQQAEASASAGVKEVTVNNVDPTTITAGMEKLHESVAKLTEHAAKEKPPVVVPAPAVHVPAPVVNVPAPVVHVAAPEKKKGKRKVRARKEKDGSFTFESDD